MATADHLYDVFLTQTSAHEISRLLEAHYERLPVGVLSIGLHTLARTALVLPASERKALAELPWFGKMMMRLGGMLSGATVTDVKGLTSILWALSCLEQAESPLLQGLVKRLDVNNQRFGRPDFRPWLRRARTRCRALRHLLGLLLEK